MCVVKTGWRSSSVKVLKARGESFLFKRSMVKVGAI